MKLSLLCSAVWLVHVYSDFTVAEARLRGARARRGPAVAAADFADDGGAGGLRVDDTVVPPVAPEDRLEPGVDDQVGLGLLPSNYIDGAAYLPRNQDALYPFPEAHPDPNVRWSPLNQSHEEAVEVLKPQPLDDSFVTHAHVLECVTSPYSWKDIRGYDCVQYSQNGWCLTNGSLGPGWALGGQGAASPQVFAPYNGIDAMQACCQCGGGIRSVVSSHREHPLSERRLVAPADRLPDTRGPLAPAQRMPGARFPDDPTHPWRPLLAPKDGFDGIVPPVAPHDAVDTEYAQYFYENYAQESRPDPMGLSARFYSVPPTDTCPEVSPGASAIDRSLDYSFLGGTGPRWLQWPAKHVANPGGLFWGRWTGTLRIFKPGRYLFDLDIGFSTESTFKIDGLDMKTWGQCRVAKTQQECSAKHCMWAMDVGVCTPKGDSDDSKAMSHRRRIAAQPLAAGIIDTPALANISNLTATIASISAPAPAVATLETTTTTTTQPPVELSCPHCADGLCLTPIDPADCPPLPYLPTCDQVAPGELCETDGECDADTRVNNCGRFDVYLKAPLPTEPPTEAVSVGPAPAAPVIPIDPVDDVPDTALTLLQQSAPATAPPVFVLAPQSTGGSPGSGPAPAPAPGPAPMAAAVEAPMAVLGGEPGEIVLRAGAHCIDVVLMVTSAGERLQLNYQGPDTAESQEVVPGQVLFCDPVIEACEKPELEACAAFRPNCDSTGSHVPPPAPAPGPAPGPAQYGLAPAPAAGPSAPAAAPGQAPPGLAPR